MPTHPRNSTRSKKKKHEENYTKTCQNQIAQNQGRNTKWIQNKTGNEEKKIKEPMRQGEHRINMANLGPVATIMLTIMVETHQVNAVVVKLDKKARSNYLLPSTSPL